jgi:DNA polymerase I
MLILLMQNRHPSGIAVAWDRPEPTFRDAIVPEYKATRSETPDLLAPQFGMVREVLDALCVACIDIPGYEADDILATMATQLRDAGQDVVVVTGDRDAFQLVEDPHIAVLYTRRGISDTMYYDEAGIEERTGVPPSKYPVLAALRGDPSDNLAGVPGVGEKTAAKLVNKYADLDGIFSHIDEQTPSLRKNLAEAEEMVRRNLEVIPLVRDVPLEDASHELKLGGWDIEEARELFERLELKTAWDRLAPLLYGEGVEVVPDISGGLAGSGGVELDLERVVLRMPSSTEAPRDLEALAAAGEPVAVCPAWSGEPGRSELSGVALASVAIENEDAMLVAPSEAIWIDAALLSNDNVSTVLDRILGEDGPGVVASQAKELGRVLLSAGVDMKGLRHDVGVAAYLLDPSSGQYTLESVAQSYLGVTISGEDKPTGQLALDAAAVDQTTGAARAVVTVAAVAPLLEARLEAVGVGRLYDTVERPLTRVLSRMELAGIAVDADELRSISADLSSQCKSLEQQIHTLAGETFNVNSTPQLRGILYDKLGLSPGRKTKTGYSTNAATLEKLRGQHPIIDAILSYREVEKLRSTYGETLLAEVAPDGRIHASFNQTVARTGRLSSEHPNLHNIPVRTEEGRRLRRAFVPAPGHLFLVADYDQIELRVIAHLSGDKGLVHAFEERRDIHRATASRVFGVTPEDVTFTQRNRAKMVSYGLAYGMEAFGLAQRLGIETSEAAEILNSYFSAFPLVRELMDRSVGEARARGYTVTLLGRRRPLPDLNSPNRGLRLAAERQAMNAGIQGLAADLFKLALVRLDAALEAARFASRLVLQVHDEVILEVPEDSNESEEVENVTRTVLAGVGEEVGLEVPLEVSSAWGVSWADAKEHS